MALDDFIEKFEIQQGSEIDIPNDAKTFTIKKKQVYFYRNGNGKYSINEGAKKISFPRFQASNYYVNYGEPFFT